MWWREVITCPSVYKLKRAHKALLLIIVPILLLFLSLWINQALFPINRRPVCQAAVQLHGKQEDLKQQRLIWWIFKIKCLSVNHRFCAMKIGSKNVQIRGNVTPKCQPLTIFCNLLRWLRIKNPFAPAWLVLTANAPVKVIFLPLISDVWFKLGLNYLTVTADCCSKYQKTAKTFLHLDECATCDFFLKNLW